MIDPRDVPAVMQAVRFQCYRENIYGALEILDSVRAAHPDPRYAAEAAASARGRRTSTAARPTSAPRRSGSSARWRAGLKQLEKRPRIWLGQDAQDDECRGRDRSSGAGARDLGGWVGLGVPTAAARARWLAMAAVSGPA
jgi:hypothetical protein